MGRRLAKLAVRGAALWVLAVSLIKLVYGTPASLPELVRDVGFGPDLNFRLSIAVELVSALVALVHPRWGFVPLAALFGVFLAVLMVLIASGAESCGCFGGALTFPPVAMLAIDGALLASMLLVRPWRTIEAGRPPWLALVPLLALALAAPFTLIPSSQPAGDGTSRPRYVSLRPATWIGRSIHETELAPWLETRALPGDATWVLYRVDCEHCRDVLRRLASEFATDPKIYVLVELAERGAEQRRVVDELPPGEHARLADDIVWDITPPWELVLEGDVVVRADAPGDG